MIDTETEHVIEVQMMLQRTSQEYQTAKRAGDVMKMRKLIEEAL